MRIRKNGKVIKLTENDLNRIVKRVLNESEDADDIQSIVKACIMDNTSLTDLAIIPQSCISMIVNEDVTMAFDCMSEMDSSDVQMILGKIKPIAKCIEEKKSGGGKWDEKPGY